MAQAMLDLENYSLTQNQIPSKQEQEQKDMETLMSTFTEKVESQQDLNFSSNDNDVQKTKKRKSYYSSTKVKARNLLTNVSYRRFKQSDFENSSFLIDILSSLDKNFNPINLDRKVDIDDERQMIKFLWDECIPHEFTKFIYKGENYNIISDPKLTYQKSNRVVTNWLVEDTQGINLLKQKLQSNFQYIHYISSLLFPKIYNRINNFGVKNKRNFEFKFSV